MTARLCLLLACTAGLATAQEVAAPLPPEDFESLFTGEDLYGWMGRAEATADQVEANRLAGESWGAAEGVLSTDGAGVGLRTERAYRCFEWLVDWSADEGAAVRLGLRGSISVDLSVGAAGSVAAAPRLVEAEARADSWNTARIRVTPAHLSVWVNGTPTVWHRELASVSAGSPPAFAAPLDLVASGGEARFQNLFLRILPEEAVPGEGPRARAERAAWWSRARWGVAVDWGLYSIPAGVWNGAAVPGPPREIVDGARIPAAEYARLASGLEGGGFDAEAWVQAVHGAGAGYLVVTSKHSDGFAMFDSAHTDFDVMRTPFGRDVMGEVSAAAHSAGLRLGWRHSVADRHDPDCLPRPAWDERPSGDASPERYRVALAGQVRELLTRYGTVDLLWFDDEDEGGWTRAAGQELLARARATQPNLLINDRGDVGRLDPRGERDTTILGDFATPAELPVGGTGLWEVRLDLDAAAGEALGAREVVRALCATAGAGGNLLLGMTAGAGGDLPAAALERLAALGRWFSVHGPSITGTSAGPFPDPAWGACTRADGLLYLHVFDWPADESLVVEDLENGIDKAWMLSDPEETFLPLQRVEGNPVIDLSGATPDEAVSVIVLAVDGEPDVR